MVCIKINEANTVCELKTFVKGKQAQTEKLEALKKTLVEQKQQLKQLESTYHTLSSERLRLESELVDLDSAKKRLQAKTQYEKHCAEKKKMEALLVELAQEIQTARNIEQLQKKHNEAEALLEKHGVLKTSNYDTWLKETMHKKTVLEGEIQTLQTQNKTMKDHTRDLDTWKKKKKQLYLQAEMKKVLSEKTEAESQLVDVQQKKEEMRRLLHTRSCDNMRHQQLLSKSAMIKTQMEASERKQNPYVSIVERAKKQVAVLENEQQDMYKQKEQLVKHKSALVFLNKAVGKNGIQNMILQNAIQDMNDELKYWCDTFFTKSSVEIHLDGEKITKKFFNNEAQKQPMGTMSGGEFKRIQLAAFFARNALVQKRSGFRTNMLIMDEPFVSMDKQGILSCVDRICDMFEHQSVYIITHEENYKQDLRKIEHQIMVRRSGGNYSQLDFAEYIYIYINI